jgi:butyrate kinase
MKQNKIIIAIAFFTVLLFAQANATDTTEGITSLPVELKFAGTIKNQPLIQLKFSGTEEETEFNITITDQHGVELYNNTVNGKNFVKQFLLNTNDLEDAVLQFEITGKKSGKKAVYKVSRLQQVTELMDVVKL